MAKQKRDHFIIGRLKSVKYAAKGCWVLLTTEHSIIVQSIIAIIMTVFGFICNLSPIEWMIQVLVIGMVLIAEAVNTCIEYICDFIHPEFHKKIGFIKDIAAGVSFIAAIIAIIIGFIIYIPKIMS